MHRNLPGKGADNGKEVSLARRVYAAGHDFKTSQGSISFYKVFLLLIAIHTSIFIIPWNPVAGLVLLLALVRGWLNGI